MQVSMAFPSKSTRTRSHVIAQALAPATTQRDSRSRHSLSRMLRSRARVISPAVSPAIYRAEYRVGVSNDATITVSYLGFNRCLCIEV